MLFLSEIMNKRAFLGMLALIILIVLISSATLYFKFYRGGLQIMSGDVTVNINYSVSKGNTSEQTNSTFSSQESQDFDDNITITDITNSSNFSTEE